MISETFDGRQWPAMRLRSFAIDRGIANDRELDKAFLAFKTEADPELFLRCPSAQPSGIATWPSPRS